LTPILANKKRKVAISPGYDSEGIGCTICSVERRAKLRVWDFLAPAIRGIGFFIKVVYIALLGWWLGPWLQRKANRSLLNDVRENFSFLFPKGHVLKQPRIRVLPFDYASVEIAWENLLFSFTRGREEVNVLVAPSHAPKMSYELGPAIAALENRHYSERDRVTNLHDAANLLQPGLEALNTAFSKQSFPAMKQKLW